MMELLINNWGLLVLPAAGALLCLGTALVILNIVLVNKGANANASWILIAFTFICLGVVEGHKVLIVLGLPNIGAAADILKFLGFVSAFAAVLYMRRLFKGLLR